MKGATVGETDGLCDADTVGEFEAAGLCDGDRVDIVGLVDDSLLGLKDCNAVGDKVGAVVFENFVCIQFDSEDVER